MLQIKGKTYPIMATIGVSLTAAVSMDERQPLLINEDRKWETAAMQEIRLDSYLQDLSMIAEEAEAESLNKKQKDRWKGKMTQATEKMEKDRILNKRSIPLEKRAEKRQVKSRVANDRNRRDPFRIFEPDPRY